MLTYWHFGDELIVLSGSASPLRFTEFINSYLSKVKVPANAEAWFSSINIFDELCLLSVLTVLILSLNTSRLTPLCLLCQSQYCQARLWMIWLSWFQLLEGKIDFHGDIVALNDDEITFVSNFYCIQTYSKCHELNVSNDVINDIVHRSYSWVIQNFIISIRRLLFVEIPK